MGKLHENWNSLSEGAGSEHLCDEINVSIVSVDPRRIEFHNVSMFESLQQMDFPVQPFEIFRSLEKIAELHLIPRHFNSFVLIEGSVTNFNKQKRQTPLEQVKVGERKKKEKQKRFLFLTLSSMLLCRELHCTEEINAKKEMGFT